MPATLGCACRVYRGWQSANSFGRRYPVNRRERNSTRPQQPRAEPFPPQITQFKHPRCPMPHQFDLSKHQKQCPSFPFLLPPPTRRAPPASLEVDGRGQHLRQCQGRGDRAVSVHGLGGWCDCAGHRIGRRRGVRVPESTDAGPDSRHLLRPSSTCWPRASAKDATVRQKRSGSTAHSSYATACERNEIHETIHCSWLLDFRESGFTENSRPHGLSPRNTSFTSCNLGYSCQIGSSGPPFVRAMASQSACSRQEWNVDSPRANCRMRMRLRLAVGGGNADALGPRLPLQTEPLGHFRALLGQLVQFRAVGSHVVKLPGRKGRKGRKDGKTENGKTENGNGKTERTGTFCRHFLISPKCGV